MKKTITPLNVQLLTFDTTLPVREVISRLDKAVNKSARFLPQMITCTSRAEIEELVTKIKGDNDFLYFHELSHDEWLNIYEGSVRPVAVVYTIGNPLIAQSIMQHDIRAGHMVPLRLMILEKADRTGTNIMYHLPSSVMTLTNNPDLKAHLQALDEKLETLVSNISAD